MTLLRGVLLNVKDGCRRPDGSYDLRPLIGAFDAHPDVPDVIGFCEAKRWADGEHSDATILAQVCSLLADRCGGPYEGRIGWRFREGDYPLALVWDSVAPELTSWGDAAAAIHDRNIADVQLSEEPAKALTVVVQHWACDDPDERVGESLRIAHTRRLRRGSRPAHGRSERERGRRASSPAGCDQGAAGQSSAQVRSPAGPGTAWMPAIQAVPELIGTCVGDGADGPYTRGGGIGYRAVCELAAIAGVPADVAFSPNTTSRSAKGGDLLIDWVLVTDALADAVVPELYGVDGAVEGLDHRLVRFGLDL